MPLIDLDQTKLGEQNCLHLFYNHSIICIPILIGFVRSVDLFFLLWIFKERQAFQLPICAFLNYLFFLRLSSAGNFFTDVLQVQVNVCQ